MKSRFISIAVAAALAFATPALAERGKPHHGDHNRSVQIHCPPGLAKKSPACVPPGKAKKVEAHKHHKAKPHKPHKHDKHHAKKKIDKKKVEKKFNKKKRYHRGERIRGKAVRIDPRRYNLPREHTYWKVDDFIYRVDPRSGLVLDPVTSGDR